MLAAGLALPASVGLALSSAGAVGAGDVLTSLARCAP